MSLPRCEMRWLRLLVGDVQTRLRNRYKVSYSSHLDTPRTCCSLIHVNIEGPTSNKIVSRLRKHDFAADGSMMRTLQLSIGFRGCALSASYLSCP